MAMVKLYRAVRGGDALYLLFRNNRLVLTGTNAPRIFCSREHYKEHKRRYNGCFLQTDVLVKYVPERSGVWRYYEAASSYDGLVSGFACSECSAFIDEELFLSDECHKRYCPSCGAKMTNAEGANSDE